MNDAVAPADPHQVPFPVDMPFRMRPHLTRLDREGWSADAPLPRLNNDAAMRAAKRKALRARGTSIGVPDPHRSDVAIARDVAAVLPRIADLRPDVVRREPCPDAWSASDPDGRVWWFPLLSASDPLLHRPATVLHARPSTQTPTSEASAPPAWASLADALALSLPEDLVWMRDTPDGGRASLLHVAFPSHWAPERRAGASLTQLHGPVADGERLRGASTALMRAIVDKGPFRTHVWSLTPSAILDRHTERSGGPTESRALGGIDDTWIRVEVQTTVPFPARCLALFTIRLLIAPLRKVLALEPGRAERLAASIRSMTDAVRRYKGLDRAEDRLLAELDAYR